MAKKKRVTKQATTSKRQQIIRLLNDGIPVKQICRSVGCKESYVYNTKTQLAKQSASVPTTHSTQTDCGTINEAVVCWQLLEHAQRLLLKYMHEPRS